MQFLAADGSPYDQKQGELGALREKSTNGLLKTQPAERTHRLTRRKLLLLGMTSMIIIILCICIPLSITEPKKDTTAPIEIPRTVSTNITSFLTASSERFTPVTANDGGKTECTWGTELIGDYCAYRGKRRHWQKLWCRSTGYIVGYLTNSDYEQARNVIFVKDNGEVLKPQFAGSQGLLGQTLGFFYLNDPACDNEFLPTLQIGNTNVALTTRAITAPSGVELIECIDCGKLRNDLQSDFCSARDSMIESHWHYDTFAFSCLMHDLCVKCSGKLQVKASQCTSWFYDESTRLCNGNSNCATLATVMAAGVAYNYRNVDYTADQGLNECQQYRDLGLLSRAWIDRGLSPGSSMTNPSLWTCVPAANMLWIAISRKSDGSAICVSSDSINCRYHETKSVCDSDKGVVTTANFLNPAPAPKMAYDVSAWTCVKAASEASGWIAVAYDNRLGYTHCLSNDGNNCRWHPTFDVCNGDRQIAATFGLTINPHRERAVGRMNAYWPTTSTVRLNYSFRIQNEANNRCVIQATQAAGQSLRFDDNCDSIATTNLITYSFDNGRLKLVDG
ncbi:hypothetical protein HDU81_001334, partial [Chytriomyces hyalinus]